MPVDASKSLICSCQPQQHSHRCRLARSVGAEEGGHLAGADAERQLVDGYGRPVTLGQILPFDHTAPMMSPQGSVCRHPVVPFAPTYGLISLGRTIPAGPRL